MTTELTTTQPLDLARIKRELKSDPRLKSNHTQRCYTADLAAFEQWRAERFFTRLLVEQYASELQAAGKSPNTINRALAAVRWYARRLGDLIQETPATTDEERREREELAAQAERAAGVESVRGSRKPKGRHLTSGELAALMEACQNDPTPAGARDAALIAQAWSAGLRRAELAGLTLADFTPTEPGEGDLLIRGKGDKERTAYLYENAYQALVDWLAIRGSEPGPVFCAIFKSGRIRPTKALGGEERPGDLARDVTEVGHWNFLAAVS